MSWEFAQVCICGRSFSDIAAFTRHNRNCQRGKKRLSGALTCVKEIYQNKWPQRLVGEEGTHSAFCEDGTALIEDPTNGYPGPSQPRESGQLDYLSDITGSDLPQTDIGDLPLSLWRSR
ncbi:hypothetical protein PISMIDRAFT_9510 [Pisolithus microcarpus 441]|uniref:Uncharacterized protein n=1 Tax=Pisolithus microcarpus 441 TaxID=765257 RepID=A0A0C9ZHM3_9AGAM|nr:hypothetical protein PISMIDRAFT_9510 [Pisolithus microcarpus 441]